MVLLALLLAFIWLHSMMPAEDSAEESQRVGQFLTPFLELFVGEGNVTDHLVRKLAHFCEYGALGILAGALLLRDMLLGSTPDWAEVFSPARSILHKQLFINAAEAVGNLLTPTAPRCPHMGCALKYNSQEHSWDCPCHGSRFAEDGSKKAKILSVALGGLGILIALFVPYKTLMNYIMNIGGMLAYVMYVFIFLADIRMFREYRREKHHVS